MADGPMPGGAGGGEMGAGEDAATPGAGGVAAAVAVAPAPAIVKKVKKVVETRLDAPELAVVLQQLSEFAPYGASGAGRAGSATMPAARVAGELPPLLWRARACRAGPPAPDSSPARPPPAALGRAKHAGESTEPALNHRAQERRRQQKFVWAASPT